MPTNKEIEDYMLQEVKFHADYKTGIVNLTTIAEDAYNTLEPSSTTDIPERYFEIALELFECDEASERRTQ